MFRNYLKNSIISNITARPKPLNIELLYNSVLVTITTIIMIIMITIIMITIMIIIIVIMITTVIIMVMDTVLI